MGIGASLSRTGAAPKGRLLRRYRPATISGHSGFGNSVVHYTLAARFFNAKGEGFIPQPPVSLMAGTALPWLPFFQVVASDGDGLPFMGRLTMADQSEAHHHSVPQIALGRVGMSGDGGPHFLG